MIFLSMTRTETVKATMSVDKERKKAASAEVARVLGEPLWPRSFLPSAPVMMRPAWDRPACPLPTCHQSQGAGQAVIPRGHVSWAWPGGAPLCAALASWLHPVLRCTHFQPRSQLSCVPLSCGVWNSSG